jgi:hypothetical protein
LDFDLFNSQMKIVYGILILALVALTGCVTKSHADAEARDAYVAGERSAYQSIAAQMTDVVVLGNVQKHEVPWVVGLTLAQVLATADYTGAQDPQEIVVKRNSTEMPVDPKALLDGQVNMTLQPGDVVEVVGQ